MSDEQTTTFSVSIPADEHACVRWSCPHCGLDFKLDVSKDLMNDVLSWSLERVLRENGLQDSNDIDKDEDNNESAENMTCPYCRHTARHQEFLHSEFSNYMEAMAVREYVEPMLNNFINSAFAGLQRMSNIKITETTHPRSPLPMIGPEPTDMVRVRCINCRCLFKVLDSWRGQVCCPQCATDLLAM